MPSTDTEEFFEISAVSNLTGVTQHVLRVWERRYEVVKPHRTESKRRQYSKDDIQRLTLLKALVDHGHSISSIASLSTSQLESRLEEIGPFEEVDAGGVCRLIVVGNLLISASREAADFSSDLSIVGEFTALSSAVAAIRPGAGDVLIVEMPSLFEDDVKTIQKAVQDLGVQRAVVVYRFASEDAIRPGLKGITPLLAPVDGIELRSALIKDISPSEKEDEELPPVTEVSGDIPKRLFSDKQLAYVARQSSVVKCECPQHLASLLTSLSAFEDYSEGCENRNAADEALHSYLHRTTALARATMEEALKRVMEEEGIVLE